MSSVRRMSLVFWSGGAIAVVVLATFISWNWDSLRVLALLKFHRFEMGDPQYKELAEISKEALLLPNTEMWRPLTAAEVHALFAKAKNVEAPTLVGVGENAVTFAYMDIGTSLGLQVTITFSSDKRVLEEVERAVLQVNGKEHGWFLHKLRGEEGFFSYFIDSGK